MHKLTVFYSVQNGGDGSAYPRFMENKELVEFDQEHMEEGWGESCTGSISFESDSLIRCLKDVETKESYFTTRYCDDELTKHGKKACAAFLAKFFPDGLPKFTVQVEDEKAKDYTHNLVFVDGRQVARVFRDVKESGEVFEKFLNSFSLE